MAFKVGTTVIGRKFEGNMSYLNGMEGTVAGEVTHEHVHMNHDCVGVNVPCQAVVWCDGKRMPNIPVQFLKEKKPPAEDRDTEWSKSLIKKIVDSTPKVKEPEHV